MGDINISLYIIAENSKKLKRFFLQNAIFLLVFCTFFVFFKNRAVFSVSAHIIRAFGFHIKAFAVGNLIFYGVKSGFKHS